MFSPFPRLWQRADGRRHHLPLKETWQTAGWLSRSRLRDWACQFRNFTIRNSTGWSVIRMTTRVPSMHPILCRPGLVLRNVVQPADRAWHHFSKIDFEGQKKKGHTPFMVTYFLSVTKSSTKIQIMRANGSDQPWSSALIPRSVISFSCKISCHGTFINATKNCSVVFFAW